MKTKLSVIIAIIAITACSCIDKEGTKEILAQEGCDSITITGWRPLACSKSDFYSTGFKAYKNGMPVKGVVTKGLLFKGKTIRWD